MNNTEKSNGLLRQSKSIASKIAILAAFILLAGLVFISYVWNISLEAGYDHAVIRAIQAGIVVLCFLILSVALLIAFSQNKALREEKEILMALDTKLKENEMLFRTIFNQAPIGIAIGHNDKYIISDDEDRPSINPMFEKITGRTRKELSNLSWLDITHPDDLKEDLEYFKKFKSGEIDRYDMEKRYIRPDGSEVWIHMIVVPLHYDSGHDYHLCIIEDINTRKNIEKALFDSEKSKAVLLNNLLGMAYLCNYDRDWTMQFVSAGCLELTGYEPECLLNNKMLSFNDLIAPEFRDILWREWERVLALKIPFRYEYEIITAKGEKKWVLEMGQGIYDEAGNVEGLGGIIFDITEKKQRDAEIQYISNHDHMTGLYNRRYYEEALIKLNCKECMPLSVIIVDINGVRLINETFGYAEGNHLLSETAKILKGCIRADDILARVGGDEFCILLPNTDGDTAYQLSNSIIMSCSSYNKNNKSRLYEINLSVGFATKETADNSMEQTVKLAEEYLRNQKLLNRKSSHSDLISSMLATVYERSKETKEHAIRLASLSKAIGQQMNLSPKSLDELELLAMLHDIGKVGIDDRVLNKPGKLDKQEWAIMKKHSEIGYRIAKSSSELEPIAEYILSHHERWDGTGYPQGLSGGDIPLLSRIIAVVDSFDAMTNDRVYRRAMTKEEAIEEIRRNAGSQFDPYIVDVFSKVINQI